MKHLVFILFLTIYFTTSTINSDIWAETGQDLPELGLYLFDSVYIDELGEKIEVYKQHTEQFGRLFIKPYLLVDTDFFQNEVDKLCGGDSVPNKVNLQLKFHVVSEEINQKILSKINQKIQDQTQHFKKIVSWPYQHMAIYSLVRNTNTGKYQSIFLTENPLLEDGRSPYSYSVLDKAPFHFGKNNFIYQECSVLKQMAIESNFRLEILTPVQNTSANLVSIVYNQYYNSDQFLNLSRTESQTGQIVTTSDTIANNGSVNLLFDIGGGGVQSTGTKSENTITDTRKRYINIESIKNSVKDFYSTLFVSVKQSFSESGLDDQSIIDNMVNRVVSFSTTVTAQIDLENDKIVIGQLERGLSKKEIISLSSVGSTSSKKDLSSSDQATLSKGKESATAKKERKVGDTQTDSRGVNYKFDGENWVPTSIELYSIGKDKINNLHKSYYTNLKVGGDKFYKTFIINASLSDGPKTFVDSKLLDFKINFTKDIIATLNSNNDSLVNKIESLKTAIDNSKPISQVTLDEGQTYHYSSNTLNTDFLPRMIGPSGNGLLFGNYLCNEFGYSSYVSIKPNGRGYLLMCK